MILSDPPDRRDPFEIVIPPRGDHRTIIIRLINNRAQGSSSPFPTFQPSELPQSYQRRLQIGCLVRHEPPYVLLAIDIRYSVDCLEGMHQRVELHGNAIIIDFTDVDGVAVIRRCYCVRIVVGLIEAGRLNLAPSFRRTDRGASDI